MRGEACRFKSARELASYIEGNSIEQVDACFCDPLGCWHHCTFAAEAVKEDDVLRGFGFDGSSVKLFSTIDNSDIIMVPDPSTCWVDPFNEVRTLHVTCYVRGVDGSEYERCPRTILSRVCDYLKSSGIADEAVFGPEAEFFIFDQVAYGVAKNNTGFSVDCEEASWNTFRMNDSKMSGVTSGSNNLAHRNESKKAYFPCPPNDTYANIRTAMLMCLGSIGVPIDKHHHEVGTCQHELGYACRPVLECADMLMSYKYVVKNVARQYNKTATFMPKPLYKESGSGMHCHQSLWKNGRNLFFDENGTYQKLSTLAMYYMGGLLAHAPAILALTNPSTNSYKRLVPGYEAPSTLAYSKGNRSAAIRIPLVDGGIEKYKRIEFRCPDASSCPYLCFAVCILAGLDGIQNKTLPGEPLDYNIFQQDKHTAPSTPASLEHALDALQNDHQFLTEHNLFSEEFIAEYIELKREESRNNASIPTPLEYDMYYSC